MKTKIIQNIPEEVLLILKALNENKYDAYIVGGCVRDSYMGIEPKDWDITTNAQPQIIKLLFKKTIDTGIKHGTVTVVLNDSNFEITTFRTDGLYLDNRRPESVTFSSSLEADLSRRDFTMNAVAYSPDKGYIDPFNGLGDVNNQIIKAVGEADIRFKEDALRMLRAIRFSSQLNFALEPSTFTAIQNNSLLINSISYERIQEELTKILLSENPMKFLLLKDIGILKCILPELEECFNILQNNPHHVFDVAIHSLKAVSQIENNKVLRWTMLLHDLGKAKTKTTDKDGIDHFYSHAKKSEELAEIILRRLKFDNNTISLICRLIKNHDREIEPKYSAVKKAISTIGEDIFMDLLKVKEADKKAQNPVYQTEAIATLDKIKILFYEIKSKNECLSLRDLAINGHDLINLGIKPNKELGLVLQNLLNAVIENPELNKKEVLIQMAKDLV